MRNASAKRRSKAASLFLPGFVRACDSASRPSPANPQGPETPAHAVALICSFYAVMIVSLACIIVLFGTTSFLGPRGRRALVLASAVVLAALGVYRIVSGVLP